MLAVSVMSNTRFFLIRNSNYIYTELIFFYKEIIYFLITYKKYIYFLNFKIKEYFVKYFILHLKLLKINKYEETVRLIS